MTWSPVGVVMCFSMRLANRWGLSVGLLMVIDDDQSLTLEQRNYIDQASRDIAAQLYSDVIAGDPRHLQQQQAVRDLLGESSDARLEAASFLVQHRAFPKVNHVVVTAVRLLGDGADEFPVDIALRVAIESANRTHSRQSALAVEHDRAQLLQVDASPIPADLLRQQAERITGELRRLVGQGYSGVDWNRRRRARFGNERQRRGVLSVQPTRRATNG